ncbi:hypothetical protein [Beijerinckia sp. L45]|uniref:hypothetical protein n=1 Tax=Beijerinckia sp. L45 TaxID=1641855 RepID=UPI00131D84D7|nr:hypothetical protein [Beijerinckia sp. L45]
MKSIVRLSLAVAIAAAAAPAYAGQSLIATPYPGAVGGNAQVLDPEPQRLGGPQHLTDDPYPQILGATAQGNAPIVGHHHHQHLVRSINQRKYRVDRSLSDH